MSDASRKPASGPADARMGAASDADAPRESVTGVELMRGIGVVRAKGFWADAWDRVLSRPGAVAGLIWIGIVAFFAVFAPYIANAHPYVMRMVDANGAVTATSYPLFANLSATDILLMVGVIVGIPWLRWRKCPIPQSERLGMLVVAALQAGVVVVCTSAILSWLDDADQAQWAKTLARSEWGPYAVAGGLAMLAGAVAAWLPTTERKMPRVIAAAAVGAVATFATADRIQPSLVNFERYHELESSGQARMTWAPIPFSPNYVRSDMGNLKPMATLESKSLSLKGTPQGARTSILGTDALGGDVLAQLLWACRLSISIGLVSTGISLLIGVTIGALMGYFGGWVDLVLFRMVEIFMAVPVLFLLIVAAGVLPRNTYVMMAIIGCFSWTGAARFTRAEFLKLRQQDFVQAAQATGMPLRSILFRHILPNGVTPVLVDASFAVAAAISVEATLSYLGLGPDGQASWGKLLSSATGATGTFVWWLAVFPGAAIFLSVLAYNLLGEALRDAIDPKLRKAAH